MKIQFSSVTVSFLIHATEDEEELLKSVSSGLRLTREEFHAQVVEGHFGNTITFVKAHLTGDRARQVAESLFKNLSGHSKSVLRSELEKSMDEHDSLYIRIDRNSLPDRLEISDEEAIKVKLKLRFRPSERKLTTKAFTELIS